MRKTLRRARCRRANGRRPRKPTSDRSARRDRTLAPHPVQDPRPLLERILDTPDLAHVVPRLQPEVLHRVIQRCGLEDCSELVALATPGQLAAVFDLDLWRADQPGLDERFDADRFGVWLEVLVECGGNVAASKVTAIDVDLTAGALAQHVRVFDVASFQSLESVDGEEMGAVDTRADALCCEIGGYRVVARRTVSWDAIVAVMLALDADHSAYFHRMMRGCRSLSNSVPEIDGLDDLLTLGDQVMFDLAVDRERRRETQGYAAPAEARAFLQLSRQLRLSDDCAPAYDPVARAYFRAVAAAADADNDSGDVAVSSEATPPESPEGAVAAIDAVLFEAGVVSRPPRALLGGGPGDAPRFARMQAQLQLVRERDYAAFSIRSQELGYLANALAVGCSIQARPLTLQEASDAAVAVCNLGLENWPAHWLPEKAHRDSGVQHSTTALADDFLLAQDLVSVFQVGWTVLYEQVCMYSAEALIDVLAHLPRADDEIQSGLDELRVEMTRHWRAGEPWRARDALDVMVILDTPAWAALLGLIDQCSVMHAGLGASQSSGTHAVSATAFDFISENSQIASVHAFMRSLPDTLRR